MAPPVGWVSDHPEITPPANFNHRRDTTFTNFCNWKDRKAQSSGKQSPGLFSDPPHTSDLRPIHETPTAEEAARQLDAFEELTGSGNDPVDRLPRQRAGKSPSIAPAWRGAWAQVTPFFAFSATIGNILDIEPLERHWSERQWRGNAVDALNRVLRKTLITKGSFPTEEAATKLIFLVICNFEKGGRAVREWVAARHQPAIMFAGRFDA